MKKILIGMVLPCLLLGSLLGCGGSADTGNDPGTPPVVQGQETAPRQDPGAQLEASIDGIVEKVFPDFQSVKMDPFDAFPLFQTAKVYSFRRLQRKIPISSKVGRTYPRILLKSYLFTSQEDLRNELEAWLSEMESSADSIVLGQHVNAVKSPPLLCAVTGNYFYMAQAACLYEGPEWEENRKKFFEEMRTKGASYIWQIKCGAGELAYELKP